VLALGIDVMGRSRGSGTSVRISTALSENRDALVHYLAGSAPESGGLNCDIATSIRSLSEDRDRVTLLDGTSWIVNGSRTRLAAWAVADGVVACEGHLISLRTGDMVRVRPDDR
jgi:hypothetical protein